MLDDFNKSEHTSDIIKPGLSRRTAIGTLLLAGVSVNSSSAAADEVSVVQSLVQYFNQGAAGIPNYNQLLDVTKLKVFSVHDGRETNGPLARDYLNSLMTNNAKFKLIGQPTAHGIVVTGLGCWIDFNPSPNDTLAYTFHIESGLLTHVSTLQLAVGACS